MAVRDASIWAVAVSAAAMSSLLNLRHLSNPLEQNRGPQNPDSELPQDPSTARKPQIAKASNNKPIRRAGIMIPAKAMPRPLSLSGSALILLSDKIPSTKAGSIVKPPDGRITIKQTREAIARRS
jgi:hypothetical protein